MASSQSPYPQRDHAVSVDERHVNLVPAGCGHDQVRAAQRRKNAASRRAVRVEAAARRVELAQAAQAGIASEDRERPGRELRPHQWTPSRLGMTATISSTGGGSAG